MFSFLASQTAASECTVAGQRYMLSSFECREIRVRALSKVNLVSAALSFRDSYLSDFHPQYMPLLVLFPVCLPPRYFCFPSIVNGLTLLSLVIFR